MYEEKSPNILNDEQENYLTGYIKLYRSLKKHWIWKASKTKSKAEAFVSMIWDANHSTLKEPIGYDLITINRGQILTSQEKLAKEWNWSRNQVRCFLEMLEHDKMIECVTTTKYTLLTLLKYETYQGKLEKTTNSTHSKSEGYKCSPPTNEQQPNNNPTTNKHPTDTNNNANNLKNVNNNITLTGENENEIPEPEKPKTDLSNSNLFRQPNIPTQEKVLEVFSFQGGTKEMADRFFEVMSAVGWYYKNSPVVDFTFLVPKFITAWKNNLIPQDKFKTSGTHQNRTAQQLDQREWLADEKRKALEAVGLNGNGSFTG